jgi:hypothetical protein
VSYTLIVSHRAGELILLYSSDKVRHPDGQKSEKIAIKRKVPPPAKYSRKKEGDKIKTLRSEFPKAIFPFPDDNSRVSLICAFDSISRHRPSQVFVNKQQL